MFDGHDTAAMARAIDLARQTAGRVEPNPMVGAIVAGRDPAGGITIISEGWHAEHGGPHAEVMALRDAGPRARGATLYVTLEPCCHHGKTPPCTDAVIAAGIERVVIAARDPFPAVDGGGIAALRHAGITVEIGLLEREAVRLTAPFRMLVERGRPWVTAKWAMSLDGALATGSDAERWLSSEESRAIVHDLRGRVDGILVGIGTVLADDPLLTARPPGARTPLRIVLDSTARLPITSRLVATAREVPVLVAVGPEAPQDRVEPLRAAGCEVWSLPAGDRPDRLASLLGELGRRRHTNLLVEGGADVLRAFFAARLVDEVWTFIAPRIVGHGPTSPIPTMPDAPPIDIEHVDHPGGDILIRGVVR
ncbi:MAG: bifunctional diaminohydroxyphosphoribosylaminopyrimidine deaminase/5-amino-6-(5-phosphoribosylamino)uracil reductase RibD [Planctomycetia bacterium]